MTEQIAIHCLKAIICVEVCEECELYGQTGTDHCEADAVRIAIEALEKQIPKKPTDISKVRDNEGYVGLIGKCPCCGEILEEDTVYCDCGQKLDWGG